MKTTILKTPTLPLAKLIGAFLLGSALTGGTLLLRTYFSTQPQSCVYINTEKFNHELKIAHDLYNAHQLDEAIDRYTKLLSPDPQFANLHMLMSLAQLQKNNYTAALWHAHQALATQHNLLTCFYVIAKSLSAQGNSKEALVWYTKALEQEPDNATTHYHMAHEYMHSGNYQQALSHAQKAHNLAPHNYMNHLLLGYIYSYEGNLTAAITAFKHATELQPTSANAHYNLGNALKNNNEFQLASVSLQKALSLQPNYPDANVALAHCYWALEQFPMAWQEYEKRWGLLNLQFKNTWDGTPLHGKTIMLFSEQGLGDTFQFVRYAQLLKRQGATVVCRVPKPLKKLLSLCPYIDKVITNGETVPYDTYAALMSLPNILHTTKESIPATIPYLHTDKKLTESWKKRLSQDKNFKIGICWYVDQTHEKNKMASAYRSIPAELFAQLADIPNVSFYSLQKFNGEDHVQSLPSTLKVHTFSKDFDEKNGRFMDTASLIENLDLIVCVDTSIAHLAAALGKNVWTLLPYSADCRWLIGRTDSPWYPTMKLFKCNAPCAWDDVMQQVKTELRTLILNRQHS